MNARYVPAHSTKVANKSGSAVAYLYATASGRLCAIGYAGKATNPGLHYSFKTEAQRAASVARFLKGADETAARRAARQAERRAELSKPHALAVGDVLYSSWGYDQTNIDFYEVVALVGKRSVMIRPIAAQSQENGFMSGDCVPAKGQYTGPAVRKLVDRFNSVRVSSYSTAGKLESTKVGGMEVFRPLSWTAYA